MPDRKWLSGSCHCEHVRFRVRPNSRTALRCNCSICYKKGFLHVIVEEHAFQLEQGHEYLETYTFNTGVAKHHFCRHCGIHPFYKPRSHPDGISVNLHCLDPEVLESFEIQDFDGRNWEANVNSIQ